MDVVLRGHRADHVVALAGAGYASADTTFTLTSFEQMRSDVGVVQPAELPQQLAAIARPDRRQHDLNLDDQIARRPRPSPVAAPARPGREPGAAGPTACPAESAAAPARRASARRRARRARLRARRPAASGADRGPRAGRTDAARRRSSRTGRPPARRRAPACPRPGTAIRVARLDARRDARPSRLRSAAARPRRRTAGTAARSAGPVPSQSSQASVNTMWPRAHRRAPCAAARADRRPAAAARARRRRTRGTAPGARPTSETAPPRTASSNDRLQRHARGPRRASASSPRARRPERRPRTARRTSPPRSLGRRREIEPVERHGRFDRHRPGRAGAAVVLAPPLEIAEHVVRLLDLAEHLLGDAITRVDARVIPPREPPIRPLDVTGRRRSRRRRAGRRDP